MRTIDADVELTWPVDLTAGLERLRTDLRAYHVERRRVEAAAQDDIKLRIDPPHNAHQEAWDEALELADKFISGSRLIAFHASRLTPTEREDVRRLGLKLLSIDLFKARLSALVAGGLLTRAQALSLLSRHQVEDDNRSGMTWFCFSRSLLRDEWGISRFFRSWGGEALYNSHEDDIDTGPILRGIGAPCIIVAAIPAATIESFMSVGKRLVNAWASRRNIPIADAPQFEGYVRHETHPQDVLRIVVLGDREFDTLTTHTQWDEPLA